MRIGVTGGTPIWPSPPMASMSGTIQGAAFVRAAISLAIWFPSSEAPSSGSVVKADLAHTLSQASSFLLSALWQ